MRNKKRLLTGLLALVLLGAGLGYGQLRAGASQPQDEAGYVCPLTGEELPCPKCCPANRK